MQSCNKTKQQASRKETMRPLSGSVLAKYNRETIFADIIDLSSISVT